MISHQIRIPSRIAPITAAPTGMVCPVASATFGVAYLVDAARVRGRRP